MSGTGFSRPPQTGHHFPTVLGSPEGPLRWPEAAHTPPSSPLERPHPPTDSHLSHAQAPSPPTQRPHPRLPPNSYFALSAPHFLPTPSQSQGPHYSPISRFPLYSGHLTSGHHSRPLFSFCPFDTVPPQPSLGGPPHPAPSARPHGAHTRPLRIRAPHPRDPGPLTAAAARPPRAPRPSGLVRSPRAQPGPRPGPGAPHSRL